MKTVRYAREALRDLGRHRNVSARIMKAIGDYAANPRAHANNVAKLSGSMASRLRIGDFRALFEETDDEILVTKVAPRGSVYD